MKTLQVVRDISFTTFYYPPFITRLPRPGAGHLSRPCPIAITGSQ